MIETEASPDLLPKLLVDLNNDGQLTVRLTGCWNLRNLAIMPDLQQKISLNAVNKATQWNMLLVDELDSTAALIIWQSWGKQLPNRLQVKPEHQRLFNRWQTQSVPTAEPVNTWFSLFFNTVQQLIWGFWAQLLSPVSYTHLTLPTKRIV